MKVRCLSILFLLLALGLVPSAQAGLTYDVAADFSTASNSGVWTYGYWDVEVGPVGFTTYNHTAALPGYEDSGVVGWAFGDSGWADPNVNKNTSTETVNAYDITWTPGTVAMGGDGYNQYATVVCWTCPEDGVYSVDALFTGVQNTGAWANWLVTRNKDVDAPLAVQQWMGYGQMLSLSGHLTLSTGDTLDFISHGMQHTSLSATITQVPEPSTFVLLVLGLLGVAAYVRRGR